MAYLDELLGTPAVQDQNIAQQMYPWKTRGPVAPPVFGAPPGYPAAPPAAPAAPANVPAAPPAAPMAAPQPVQPVAPRSSFPAGRAPMEAVPLGLSANADRAPDVADQPLEPVKLGTMADPVKPRSAQETLQASQAPQLHGWKKVLDIAGQVEFPRLEEAIPGTPGYYETRTLPKLKADAEAEAKAATEAREEQNMRGEYDKNEAMARNYDRKDYPPKTKPIVYAGPNGEPLPGIQNLETDEIIDAQGNTVQNPQMWEKPAPTKEPSQEDRDVREWIDAHPKDFPADAGGNRYIASNMAKARQAVKAAGREPKEPPHTLVAVPQPDGSSKIVEAKPGSVLPKGAQTVSEFGKSATPTADEQRRADLAENMSENLNQLEDIVKRRPDLFGPAAGRLTSVRGWVGSNDPDIGALETLKHQLGMAQLGAHSMRSAQGVEKAAESILNGFKNGPNAVMQSITDARNSLKTFSGDVTRKGGDAGPAKTYTDAEVQAAVAAHPGMTAQQIEDAYKAKGYTKK